MLSNRKNTKVGLFLVICILPLFAHAQIRISSPYSRFGLGDMQLNSNTRLMGMGGVGIAYRSPKTVNFLNPASYSAFNNQSFLFEGGIRNYYSQQKTNTLEQDANYTSLSYLLFGFPVTKWLKGSFGLMPFSSVGYKITDEGFSEQTGRIDYIYEGDGGINRFNLGQAVKINNNFSLGINASYLFGTIENTRSAEFPDSAYMYNAKLRNSTSTGGFYFDFGLQYYYVFEQKNDDEENQLNQKDNLFIGIGLVFSPSTTIAAKDDFLSYSYIQGTYGDEYSKDTIEQYTDKEGDIVLPMHYGIGLSFGKADKWVFEIDYAAQNWSEYLSFGKSDSLQNSMQLAAGLEIIPDINSISSYFKRIKYRFGGRYGKTYLQLKGTQLEEYAVSMGFGFPLKRGSSVDLALEYGIRGTTDNDLIREDFFKINLAFSIYEFWFFKRKYE